MQKTWTWSTRGHFGIVGKSHEEIQAICKKSGLAGIEGVIELFEGVTDSELEEIGKGYKEAGLKIATFHLPYSREDDIASFYETDRAKSVEKAQRWIERAVLLGATVGIQHPTTKAYNVDVEGLDNCLRQLGKSMTTLLPVAEKLGFTIALENMLPGEAGRLGSRPKHFEKFVAEFDHPNLGFCLDTGHALVAGGSEGADKFYEVMAPKIVAFHLADNAGDRDSHLAPGHGLVDWNVVFRRTAEIGFSGTMCIETPPFAHGPDYTVESWQGMVADADSLVEKALGGC